MYDDPFEYDNYNPELLFEATGTLPDNDLMFRSPYRGPPTNPWDVQKLSEPPTPLPVPSREPQLHREMENFENRDLNHKLTPVSDSESNHNSTTIKINHDTIFLIIVFMYVILIAVMVVTNIRKNEILIIKQKCT